jgi:hypothetical protein
MTARKKATSKKPTKKKAARKRRSAGTIATPRTNQQFQAEMDAGTLADAEAIRGDSKRLSRANREIKRRRDALDEALKSS